MKSLVSSRLLGNAGRRFFPFLWRKVWHDVAGFWLPLLCFFAPPLLNKVEFVEFEISYVVA